MGKKLSLVQGLAGLAFGLACIWWLASGDDDKGGANAVAVDAHAPLLADALAKRVGTIRNVQAVEAPSDKNGHVFVVTVKPANIMDSGDTSKKVLNSIANHGSQLSYQGVEIHVVLSLVDSYGRTSDDPVMQLDFPREDVEKFNFENVVGWDILNVAQVYSLDPVSAKLINEECADTTNAKYAARFCATAPMAGRPLSAELTN